MILTDHARARMWERGIAREQVDAVVSRPVTAGLGDTGHFFATGAATVGTRREWLTVVYELDPLVIVTVMVGRPTAAHRAAMVRKGLRVRERVA